MSFSGLDINGVDLIELYELLQTHFGMASRPNSRETTYSRQDQCPCLTVKLDKKRNLSSIEIGDGILPNDVIEINNKIEHELRNSCGISVYRETLFYTVPVRSAFRYDEVFQIFPVPVGAPLADSIQENNPFIIENAVPASSNPFTSLSRGRREANKIVRLLNILLNFRVSRLPRYTSHVWTWDDINSGSSVSVRQIAYNCHDPEWAPNIFTRIESHQTSKFVEAKHYYAMYGVSGDESLDLPDNICRQLEAFYRLSAADRTRFERACYWYEHAFEVWRLSNSASYIALVSAIESMLEMPKSESDCPACGKPQTGGPTKQFRNFIETHVPGAENFRSVKKELYSLRSRLAHGSRLLAADADGWNDPRHFEDDHMHRQLTRLVQIALINWLATRPKVGGIAPPQ